MKRLVTAEQMRALESLSAKNGVTPSMLMETAGHALAEAALSCASIAGQFVVLCGPGNNGGDGLVAARFLRRAGRKVSVELLAEAAHLKGDCATNARALEAVGVPLRPLPAAFTLGPGDVVIDAVFGTGLSRAPEGRLAEAVARMARWRHAGAKVVAADLPSGLSTETGRPFGSCVAADVTVAFGALKLGHALEPGASLCGEIRLADLGLAGALDAGGGQGGNWLLEEDDVQGRLPICAPEGHKGTYGHLLLVAGSWGKTGAAGLAGLAALRTGVGLCTVATRPEALVPVLAHAPELMGLELVGDGPLSMDDLPSLLEAAAGKQAVVLGPGIPRGAETGQLLVALLSELTVPCLLDADALNAVAAATGAWPKPRAPLVMTPHPGEMARLMGRPTQELLENRLATAREAVRRWSGTVVYKGARTVIASPDGTVWVNPTGNPGMATGGMGDVLSGMVGALLAQGLAPDDAALAAVYAHGRAADRAALATGQLGLLPTDVVRALGEVWRGWGR